MVQTNNSVRQIFGYNVKTLREMKGWTREELAKRLDLSGATVSAIESGTKFVTAETLALIANTFAVPLSRLLAATAEATSEQIRSLTDRDQKVVWALVKVLGEVK